MWWSRKTHTQIHASSSSRQVSLNNLTVGWTRHKASFTLKMLTLIHNAIPSSFSSWVVFVYLNCFSLSVLSSNFYHCFDFLCICVVGCRFSVSPFHANYHLSTQTQLLVPSNLNCPFSTTGTLSLSCSVFMVPSLLLTSDHAVWCPCWLQHPESSELFNSRLDSGSQLNLGTFNFDYCFRKCRECKMGTTLDLYCTNLIDIHMKLTTLLNYLQCRKEWLTTLNCCSWICMLGSYIILSSFGSCNF